VTGWQWRDEGLTVAGWRGGEQERGSSKQSTGSGDGGIGTKAETNVPAKGGGGGEHLFVEVVLRGWLNGIYTKAFWRGSDLLCIGVLEGGVAHAQRVWMAPKRSVAIVKMSLLNW
jgi:hypothetical protein